MICFLVLSIAVISSLPLDLLLSSNIFPGLDKQIFLPLYVTPNFLNGIPYLITDIPQLYPRPCSFFTYT
ncbi:hypothetical protein CW304_06680 [Bacillus sp. UFRGS-B20]|nr:hypothetical protein CW304_06680 [Bacillus sp. UFRGS-B20]